MLFFFLLLALADAAISALLPVFLRSEDVNPIVMAALIATAPLIGAFSGTIVPREGSPTRLLRISCTITILAASPAALFFALAGSGQGMATVVLAFLAVAAFGVTIAADVPTMTGSMMMVPDALRAPFVSIVQPGLMGIQAFGALAAGAMASLLPTTSTMAIALVLPVAYSSWALIRSAAACRDRPSVAGRQRCRRCHLGRGVRRATAVTCLAVRALVIANSGDDDAGHVGERLQQRGFELADLPPRR